MLLVSVVVIAVVAGAYQFVPIFSEGVDEQAGSTHFIQEGVTEGRARDLFDAGQYLENYADLQDVFGTDEEAATRHYITTGFFEGRTDDASTSAADFLL